MVEKILAGLGLAACVALLLWMLLGPRRREALLAFLRRSRHWHHDRKTAQIEAAKAIERARRPVIDRQGNVYRPRSFDQRTPKSRDRDDNRR